MVTTSTFNRRPKAQTLSVQDLLEEVRRGRIRVPVFQRAFSWKSTHIVELFDSIYRGYPIGDLLFAVRDAPAEALYYGPVRIEAAVRSEAWYLVDGQQRINALAGALLHPSERPLGDRHAIWFDLENERFERLTTSDIGPAWVPVNVLSDHLRTLQWANGAMLRDNPDLVTRLFQVSGAIREYQVPLYLLDGRDEATLREVFRRVNLAGVSLKAEEVFNALLAPEGEVPALDAAVGRLRSLGFGEVKKSWLERAARHTGLERREAGPPPEHRGGVRAIDETEERTRTLGRVVAGMADAFKFLMSDCRVPHIGLLPYQRPLLVLTKFFQRFPLESCSPRERALLRRWWWRGALSGEHEGTANAEFERDLAGLGGSAAEAVEHLLGRVSRSPEAIELDGRWSRAGTALSCRFVLALWQLAPLGLDERPVEPSVEAWENQKKLVVSPFSDQGETALAERLILCDPDGMLLDPSGRRDAARQLAERPALWASHGLDHVAAEALLAGDAERFITARRNVLAQVIPPRLAWLTGAGQTDRPAIGELVARARSVVVAEGVRAMIEGAT